MNPESPLVARPRRSDAPPADPARFLGLIAPELDATEAVFREHLASDVPFIHETGVYLSAGGGKRMRPALLLLAARLLNRSNAEAITYAAVVEYIHTATLIHDDIIDHATLRRGKRTVNHLWGNNQTVLLGDWLYTKAMHMALSHGNLAVVSALCDATLRMTEGELLSFARLGASNLSAPEYFSILERKTARLFAAACAIPAIMAPRQPEAEAALNRYGMKLGICFQLVDDLLDFTGQQSEVGKPVLSDLKEGRLTLPLLLLLQRVDTTRRMWIETVLEDRAFVRVSPEQILELVAAEGTVEEVEELAERTAAEARAALAVFPESEAREALEFAPEFVLHRRS